MIKFIESSDNKEYKKYKSLLKKQNRQKLNLFLLDGKKLFIEALKSNVCIEKVLINEQFDFDYELPINIEILKIKNSLFEKLTEMENSEGIITVCKFLDEKNLHYNENFLVLDNIRDPGNMGTIIRTAESFNYKNILLLNNCVDIYNNKVLRSAMGSVFRTNIVKIDLFFLKELKKTHEFYSMALLEKSESLYNMTDNKKHAIIIGNEANGISKEVIALSDKTIIIPINNNVESLNASIAASVTMFYFNLINTKMEKITDNKL